MGDDLASKHYGILLFKDLCYYVCRKMLPIDG